MVTRDMAPDGVEKWVEAPADCSSRAARADFEVVTAKAPDNIPGVWHEVDWAQLALALEREPGGATYRGHVVAWVGGLAPGRWLHEVDGNIEWRFDSLAAAMTFIDVLES
jgi:hypothetical protein